MNTGTGFFSLSVRAAAIVWVSSVAGLAMVVTVAPWLSMMTAVALGLVLGGSSSNFGDRVLRGAVVDFIGVLRWRTFNVADVAMVTGTAMAVWSLL